MKTQDGRVNIAARIIFPALTLTFFLRAASLTVLILAVPTGTAFAVDIETVPVGNPGNAPDTRIMQNDYTTGYGCVSYAYRIGKYEVTKGQYAEFLNAVGRTDRYYLYSSSWTGIQRSGSPGSYTYTVSSGQENLPVVAVSWASAARFCNWLSNGQPSGLQDLTTTEDGSYYLHGETYDIGLISIKRKAGARYVIPTEDEWYKAAYHKNNGVTGDYWHYPVAGSTAPDAETPPGGTSSANYAYATQTLTPIGAYSNSASPYGTFDQGGNAWEWNEAVLFNRYRGLRGGSLFTFDISSTWRNSDYPAAIDEIYAGFRIALVPEPATLLLVGVAAARLLLKRRPCGTPC